MSEINNNETIMYCIFAKESVIKMNGNRGKLASMAGHAFLHSYWDGETRFRSYYGGLEGDNVANPDKYKDSGKAKKVTLIVDTVEELKALEDFYEPICGVSLVRDAGLTVFTEPTTVCLGIGPIRRDEVEENLSSLPVFI